MPETGVLLLAEHSTSQDNTTVGYSRVNRIALNQTQGSAKVRRCPERQRMRRPCDTGRIYLWLYWLIMANLTGLGTSRNQRNNLEVFFAKRLEVGTEPKITNSAL